MSRWSQEEDAQLLEFIQEIQESIDYEVLSETHNNNFNTQRSEESLKARVKKIAKENNINLKSNNHWTEDEKSYIVDTIKVNPLNINWSNIATHLKRSELSVKSMYNEIVSAKEHIECCILNINEDNILQIIKDNKHSCSSCNINMYSNPCIWKGCEYCDTCYYEKYNEESQQLWRLVREYSIRINKNYCNICNKKATFDNSMSSRFHYDHINMFDKSDSICKMVREGAQIDDIYDEINKCQLLCISCHSVVTKVEVICGFNRIKRQMTKEYNETNNEEIKNKLNKEYYELYNNFMIQVYNYIRKSI